MRVGRGEGVWQPYVWGGRIEKTRSRISRSKNTRSRCGPTVTPPAFSTDGDSLLSRSHPNGVLIRFRVEDSSSSHKHPLHRERVFLYGPRCPSLTRYANIYWSVVQLVMTSIACVGILALPPHGIGSEAGAPPYGMVRFLGSPEPSCASRPFG